MTFTCHYYVFLGTNEFFPTLLFTLLLWWAWTTFTFHCQLAHYTCESFSAPHPQLWPVVFTPCSLAEIFSLVWASRVSVSGNWGSRFLRRGGVSPQCARWGAEVVCRLGETLGNVDIVRCISTSWYTRAWWWSSSAAPRPARTPTRRTRYLAHYCASRSPRGFLYFGAEK